MMKRLRKLFADERGNSLIELGLVLPLLGTLVVGMVDVSRGYSAKLQLEQAAQRSIEKAMNGKKQVALYNTLVAEAMAAASVPASAVTVRYWLECNGVSQNNSAASMAADYEKKCADNIPYARYISVRIEKTYTPMFQAKWLGANADGTFSLVGQAGLRVQ